MRKVLVTTSTINKANTINAIILTNFSKTIIMLLIKKATLEE